MHTYQTRQFALSHVQGLSAKQLEAHLKLYAGYVLNTNTLMEKIALYKQDSATHAVALAELVRRFGFEFNGMRLHEYYFEQLEQAEASSVALRDALAAQWGSLELWQKEFTAIGLMRGIGWVLLVQDEVTGNLHNIWVSDHEVGHLAGQRVLVAMDVWEHAYLLDYLPSERSKYIETFFANFSWAKPEMRFGT